MAWAGSWSHKALPFVLSRWSFNLEVRSYALPLFLLSISEASPLNPLELISQSKSLLLEGGMIALEIGDGQAETVSDVLLEEGYKKIESLKDISQIDRFVVATL